MRAGDRLDEHSAPGPISLGVREGRVRFTAADEVVEAGTETVITCDAGVRHTVEALSDAVCLAWRVAGWWGLDRWLLPAIGVPGYPGTAFGGRRARGTDQSPRVK